MSPWGSTAAWRPSRQLLVNQLCDEFEAEWVAGRRPQVSMYLARASRDESLPLLRELVLLDAEYRRRAGENPTPKEYAARHPQLDPVWLGESLGDSACEWPVPRTLGEYDLGERIGAGGMGVVFRARHRRMNRDVAVKVLPPAAGDRESLRRRFFREVEVTARLSHPNVVTAFDAREDDGVAYLVTEYVDGCDLGRLVRREGPLSETAAVGYARQAAAGLDYAHARGVTHRDVKPSNLLLDRAGVVRVADWGLARLRRDRPSADSDPLGGDLTEPGAVLGTVDYLAPEQAARPDEADPRSDVYSLGCSLFHFLTGRPPFPGGTAWDRILAHRDRPAPDVRHLRPDVPDRLAELIGRTLSKRPAARPQCMDEVIAALDAAAGQTARWPTRRQALRGCAILGAAIAPAVGWLAAWAIRPRGQDARPPDNTRLATMPVPDPAGYQRQWADDLELPVEMTDACGVNLVLIPPGTFRMGSPPAVIDKFADPAVEPDSQRRAWVRAEQQRPVTIRRLYYLGRTEVTHGQFAAFVEDTGYVSHAERFGGGYGFLGRGKGWVIGPEFNWKSAEHYRPTAEHPVVNVCWKDAKAFCEWLTGHAPSGVVYRLPGESEWEYACRAGREGLWSHGDDRAELIKFASYNPQPGPPWLTPRAVARRRPNGFGLYDMHGSHAEWCEPTDPWSADPARPAELPADWRPARGGTCNDPPARMRAAARFWLHGSSVEAGFRVLREVPA